MSDIISIVTAFSAIIAVLISLLALIISIKQFSLNNRLGQLPFLNIRFIEIEEGYVPNIISILSGNKSNENHANLDIELHNVGLGVAKDIRFEYNDNLHDKEYYFAFNNVLLPSKSVTYSFHLSNLAQDHFDGYDFELNIYYKDIFNNAYLLKTHGIYLIFGDKELKPKLTFISETQTIKNKHYPRTGKTMKYIEAK